MSLKNVWHHRRVADGQSKPCWICYKPSTSVLITPDNKPDADEAAAAAARKKKEELDLEIEKVKKEYEEKQKKKREKRKEKEKEADKDKDKSEDTKKADDEDDKNDEKAKDDKIKELSESKDQAQADLGPRIFTLKKNFYQMRIDKIRNAEIAKRNRERLSNPANFPSPPSGNP